MDSLKKRLFSVQLVLRDFANAQGLPSFSNANQCIFHWI